MPDSIINQRLILLNGPQLEGATALAAPVISAMQADKGDGIEITQVDATNGGHAAAMALLADALARNERPIVLLQGHGMVSGETGRHVMGLSGGFIPDDTLQVIKEVLDGYEQTYKAQHGEQTTPPRLTVAVSSCFGGALIKNLSPEILRRADIITDDSQQVSTWQSDLPKMIRDLGRGGSAESMFVRQLVDNSTSSREYSLPAIITSDGVLDGDALRARVADKNFASSREAALARVPTLPIDLQANVHAEITRLNADNFNQQGNERSHALLGYLANYAQRYAPLAGYAEQGELVRQFMDAATPTSQLPALLGQMDKNNLHMLSYAIQGNTEYLGQRYRALASAGVNVLQGAAFQGFVDEALATLPPADVQRMLHVLHGDDSPLMTAIRSTASLQTVTALIAAGAPVNYVDKEGYGALYWAVAHERLDVMELLIAKQADVNVHSVHGVGLVVTAAALEKHHAAGMLVAAGADTSMLDRDKDGLISRDEGLVNIYARIIENAGLTKMLDPVFDKDRSGHVTSTEAAEVLVAHRVRWEDAVPDRMLGQLNRVAAELKNDHPESPVVGNTR